MQESLAVKSRRIRLIATLARLGSGLMLLAMFAGTHYPGDMQLSYSPSDKTMHFVCYLVLTVLVLASWELSTGLLRPAHYFFVWLSGTIYGVVDELTQIPVGRTCSMSDWLADVIGIVAGLILFRLVRLLFNRWR